MPASLLVTLQLDAPAPSSPHVPLHALTYQLIEHASGPLARALHDAQVNPLSQHTARRDGFGGVLGADRCTVQLRVNCLQDTLLPALTDAFAPGLPLPGDRNAQLRGRIVGQVTEHYAYDDLAAQLPARDLQLDFRTPTALKSGGAFQSRPRPAWVYHGLLRRWNAFAPIALPADAWAHLTDDLRVLDQDTSPLTLAVPGSARRGTLQAFTGAMTLTVARARALEAFQALSALAPYAGVGAKTLYGFGAVDVRAVTPTGVGMRT